MYIHTHIHIHIINSSKSSGEAVRFDIKISVSSTETIQSCLKTAHQTSHTYGEWCHLFIGSRGVKPQDPPTIANMHIEALAPLQLIVSFVQYFYLCTYVHTANSLQKKRKKNDNPQMSSHPADQSPLLRANICSSACCLCVPCCSVN